MTKMTTEEAFIKVLQMHGIEHSFGIIGSAFMAIFVHASNLENTDLIQATSAASSPLVSQQAFPLQQSFNPKISTLDKLFWLA